MVIFSPYHIRRSYVSFAVSSMWLTCERNAGGFASKQYNRDDSSCYLHSPLYSGKEGILVRAFRSDWEVFLLVRLPWGFVQKTELVLPDIRLRAEVSCFWYSSKKPPAFHFLENGRLFSAWNNRQFRSNNEKAPRKQLQKRLPLKNTGNLSFLVIVCLTGFAYFLNESRLAAQTNSGYGADISG